MNFLNQNQSIGNTVLDPWYVTGLSDAESNFYICLFTNKNSKKVHVRFFFVIAQRDHSVALLEKLQMFFNCGIISVHSKPKKTMRLTISKRVDIQNAVIPHFLKYPLKGSKKLNFQSFVEAFEICKEGAHLTPEGIARIMEIKNSMNDSRSFEDKFNSLQTDIQLNSGWVHGFSESESCFGAYIKLLDKIKKNGLPSAKVVTNFTIGQSIHEIGLLDAIRRFFNEGNIRPKFSDISDLNKIRSSGKNAAEFYLTNTKSIISFFNKHPLNTKKQLDFLDFKQFVALKESKTHFTIEGVNEMFKIASGMNTGRFGVSRKTLKSISKRT